MERRRLHPGRVALIAFTAAVLAAAPASAAPHFFDGTAENGIPILGCISGSPEFEVGTYVGEYVDENLPSPVVGEVFDVHIVAAAIGNSCAGTAANLEIALPPGVTPAISKQHRIFCFLGPIGNMQQVGEECPDQLGPGLTNTRAGPWYSLIPDGNFPAWPLAQGSAVDIRVPVRSSRILNGFGDTSGCVCVLGSVSTSNGDVHPEFGFDWPQGSPGTGPYLSMFVFRAGKASYGFPKKVKTAKAKRKGIPVTVKATAGAVKHKLKLTDRRGRKLGKATFKATEPATAKLKVKLSARGRKAVKKGLRKLTLTASSSGEGAKPATRSGKVKLT